MNESIVIILFTCAVIVPSNLKQNLQFDEHIAHERFTIGLRSFILIVPMDGIQVNELMTVYIMVEQCTQGFHSYIFPIFR